MNRREIAALLSHAGELDSRIQRRLTTEQQAAKCIRTWASMLKHVPSVATKYCWDVTAAVRAYYEQRGGDRSAQFRAIEPADIIAAWALVSRNILSRHSDPLPTADADDVAAFRAELAASRAAVIHGLSAPGGVRELTEHPHVGRPADVSFLKATAARIRRELAQRRLTRSSVEESGSVWVRAA